MSLFANLNVTNPVRTQAGTVFAPVKAVDLGCNTGNSSTHTNATLVQTGLARTLKSRKRAHTRKHRHNKASNKKRTKHRRRTMNRKRKNRKRKNRKRKSRRKRVNQVGRGTTYANVLENTANMGPRGTRSDSALVNLQ